MLNGDSFGEGWGTPALKKYIYCTRVTPASGVPAFRAHTAFQRLSASRSLKPGLQNNYCDNGGFFVICFQSRCRCFIKVRDSLRMFS